MLSWQDFKIVQMERLNKQEKNCCCEFENEWRNEDCGRFVEDMFRRSF